MNNILIFLLITTSLSACVEAPKTIEYDKSLALTEIDGYQFHTVAEGDEQAPLVIVVHGGPGADHHYLTPLSPLAENYRVVFYDQRGTGLSPRVDKSQLTLEQNLEDLNSLIDYFSAGNKVKLIGHSWGGMLVSGYIGKYPEKVSHAVIVEPGMLDSVAALAFASELNNSQSVTDMLTLLKHLSVYPFVKQQDGHEGLDYVLTKSLNNNKPGAPYQCEGIAMPENSFKRGGYEAFSSMMMPVMDAPELFTWDLTKGLSDYKGGLLMISSECSFIGYDFQEKYHISKMPKQTLHIKALDMGHYMLSLNPQWSVKVISDFFSG